MANTQARIISVSGDSVTLQAEIVSACSSCEAKSTCSQPRLSERKAKKIDFTLDKRLFDPHGDTLNRWAEGQTVSIEADDRDLVKLSLVTYLLPLVSFFLFVWAASSEGASESAELILGVLGFCLGCLVSTRMNSNMHLKLSTARQEVSPL